MVQDGQRFFKNKDEQKRYEENRNKPHGHLINIIDGQTFLMTDRSETCNRCKFAWNDWNDWLNDPCDNEDKPLKHSEAVVKLMAHAEACNVDEQALLVAHNEFITEMSNLRQRYFEFDGVKAVHDRAVADLAKSDKDMADAVRKDEETKAKPDYEKKKADLQTAISTCKARVSAGKSQVESSLKTMTDFRTSLHAFKYTQLRTSLIAYNKARTVLWEERLKHEAAELEILSTLPERPPTPPPAAATAAAPVDEPTTPPVAGSVDFSVYNPPAAPAADAAAPAADAAAPAADAAAPTADAAADPPCATEATQ